MVIALRLDLEIKMRYSAYVRDSGRSSQSTSFQTGRVDFQILLPLWSLALGGFKVLLSIRNEGLRHPSTYYGTTR